ncbi:hypothetical protein K438DRAFT_2011445 [Mycena galopus ATCC 62051]|nr:hypothetical protein K438DRAFT_2011445 [Mycena galopus ATCC 62051]
MDSTRSICGEISTDLPTLEAHDLFAPPGTRHHTLLNTNEPLEDSDIGFIHSVISKTDARLQRLEEERVLLSSYQTRNKALLQVSPLRRMPSELLGKIFLLTLSSIAVDLLVGGFDMVRSPWVLTHISSRWRAIALSIPSLWSWVTIDYTTDDKPPGFLPHYSLALVETQIRRAQKQKLKIHFYGSAEVPSLTQVQIFELLAQHSSRWEELSVEVTQEMVPTVIALRDRVPSLTRLWIQWGDGSRASLETLDCFQTAPSLLDFGTYNGIQFTPITLPTHQLTHLRYNGPWGILKGILASTQTLLEANISLEFDQEPWPDARHTITLPHLRRLYVSHLKILQYLRAPAVEGLAFWVMPDEPPDPDFDNCLPPFLDRLACPLRRLCVRGFPNAHKTIEMLQRFPSITELAVIVDSDEAQPEIDFLMWNLIVSVSGSDAVVAPQLCSLFFASRDDCSIDHRMFSRMVRSRWGVEGSALKNAALAMKSPEMDRATLLGLAALRYEGLDVSLVMGIEVPMTIRDWLYSTTWN